VQMNTLEQLIVFVPATFAFARYVSGSWVLLPGAVFIIGRLMYSSAYLKDPRTRAPGMIATMLANTVLVIAVLIKVLLAIF
nr:MAPEG family protein [Xanthomonadales bacterium]NIX13796.1 MAPEG family protein [Xanthomonadales bacterium]